MAITANIAPLRLLYGVYAWTILAVVVLPVSIGLLVLPGVERRRRLARRGAAAVLRLIGSPVMVRGDPAALGAGAVVVANHASYLDGIILTAVLPPHYTFLIKREMNAVPLAGFVLRRLKSEFVHRADAGHRHRTARRLITAARTGSAIAVFPEGTFDQQPGLKPFHSGAFRAAIRAGTPVVPVVITGARAKLPSEAWLPRPGPLAVTICDPIPVEAMTDAMQLSRVARERILERLGEPDLATAQGTP